MALDQSSRLRVPSRKTNNKGISTRTLGYELWFYAFPCLTFDFHNAQTYRQGGQLQ